MTLKRSPEDSIFEGLVPDNAVLDKIYFFESKKGLGLVKTVPIDALEVLNIHKNLEKVYGKILHLQLNANRNGQPIGINLYFTKALDAVEASNYFSDQKYW